MRKKRIERKFTIFNEMTKDWALDIRFTEIIEYQNFVLKFVEMKKHLYPHSYRSQLARQKLRKDIVFRKIHHDLVLLANKVLERYPSSDFNESLKGLNRYLLSLSGTFSKLPIVTFEEYLSQVSSDVDLYAQFVEEWHELFIELIEGFVRNMHFYCEQFDLE